MPDLHHRLARMANRVDQRIDSWFYRPKPGPCAAPVRIFPFPGFITAEQIYLKGRVLVDKAIPAAGERDTVWANLRHMFLRFESDEIPGARLLARYRGLEQVVVADEEGFFEVEMHPPDLPPGAGQWEQVELGLLEPQLAGCVQARALAPVMHIPETAGFGVISDIDDTVWQSYVNRPLHLARTLFLGNAHTRQAFPGVAAFYHALQLGTQPAPVNPIFYVSSTPWNIFDVFVQFCALQSIPAGPTLFLRGWGIQEDEILPTRHHKHKLNAIRSIFDRIPRLPFILIGDSGQLDAEIYAQAARADPERVLAVYIRDVLLNARRTAAIQALAGELAGLGVDLVLSADTGRMAEHAAQRGWISATASG